MLYLHDVWVNWFVGKKSGYQVCAYYEWRKKDRIEMLEQIPVLYIQSSLFHTIENSLQPLPSSLLNQIHKKTTQKKGCERKKLTYACIVTDGKGVLAIDTGGFNIPLRKSRLTTKQEQEVYKMCERMKQQRFLFAPRRADNASLLDIDPKYMYGLTRKERELKSLLLMAVRQLERSRDISELLYWLAEWKNEKLSYAMYQLNEQELYRLLYNEVKRGWSKEHERFCMQLMKGKPFLEKYVQTIEK